MGRPKGSKNKPKPKPAPVPEPVPVPPRETPEKEDPVVPSKPFIVRYLELDPYREMYHLKMRDHAGHAVSVYLTASNIWILVQRLSEIMEAALELREKRRRTYENHDQSRGQTHHASNVRPLPGR